MNCNTTHYRANSSSVPGDPTGFYTAAPLDEEISRYTLFIERLEQHLTGKEPARDKWVKGIHAGLAEYGRANETLESANRGASHAATALQRARTGWERQMEKLYGALLAELGKARAEQFFPRISRKSGSRPDTETPNGDPNDSGDGTG